MANAVGDCGLQEEININYLPKLEDYLNKFCAHAEKIGDESVDVAALSQDFEMLAKRVHNAVKFS